MSSPRSAYITITVPMPPPMANRRSSNHWRTIYNAKRVYFAMLDERQLFGLIDRPPATPIKCASIRSVMRLGGAMDDDNAMHRHKWLLDWLKNRGYIADDRKKNLTWESLPEQIVKRDGDYSITITLTKQPRED